MRSALQKAIDTIGGQSKLAQALGVPQPTVWFWLNQSKKGVPAEYCRPIEKKTGVPVSALRPDIFGTKGAA